MNNSILIIGGGIAGLTTAIALQEKNIDFMLYEAVDEIKAVGAGISLAGNAMRVLRELGVADEVKKRGHLISSMIIEDQEGKQISVMDAEKLSREHGLDNVAIHRSELHQALLKYVPAHKIMTGKKAVNFEEHNNGVTIDFHDGSKAEGSGAIIADGINSAIRKKLLPDVSPRYSGYTCWRGVVANKWNIQQHAVEAWGASGRFGYVPIGNNQVYWFACKNAPYKDETMSRFKVADLVNNFINYKSPIPQMIESTRNEDLIWSDIIDMKPLSRFAFGKILMIGDAAHATTPNLGQGACMAMEDALMAAKVLNEQSDNRIEAFQSFEQKRIARTHFIVNTSYRLGKVAQWENNLLISVRNSLLRMTPAWANEKQVEKVLDI